MEKEYPTEAIRISMVQANLYWEEKAKNRTHLEQLLKQVSHGDTDLIVLPEMFDTAFSMNAAAMAKEGDSGSLKWMQAIAKEKNAVVTGSLMVQEHRLYYNRMYWVYPDGTYITYNKRHLFGLMKEDEVFEAGDKRVIAEWKSWRFCLQICYDLRFPVWSRYQGDYDVLLYVANWPERRVYAWQQLLCARAIENQSYSVGVNRVGDDGNGVHFTGASMVYDPLGKPLSSISDGEEAVLNTTLFPENLEKIRKGLPFLKDADRFSIDD